MTSVTNKVHLLQKGGLDFQIKMGKCTHYKSFSPIPNEYKCYIKIINKNVKNTELESESESERERERELKKINSLRNLWDNIKGLTYACWSPRRKGEQQSKNCLKI